MGSQLARETAYTIFGSAVAGYGFAIGRDAWRHTKKNGVILLILAVLLCGLCAPFFAARGLVRYHQRGFLRTLLVSILGNALLWCVGVSILFMTFVFLEALFSAQPSSSSAMQGGHGPVPLGFFPLFILAVVCITLAGFLVGLWQRSKRQRAFTIALDNDRLLARHGIQETGGHDITHVDDEGNNLRLMEINKMYIVFMAVGRRNRRAYIRLDREGRMVEYTGVVAIA
jgi:hypothetical protein